MGRDGGDDSRAVGIGVHQAVELLLGIFLVISSTRVPGHDAGVVLAFGVTLLVLPSITAGPLAAFRVLAPVVHRALDVVIVMLAVVSPILLDLAGNTDLIIVLAGLALAALTRSTSYALRRRSRRSAPAPRATTPAMPPAVIPPSPPVAPKPPPVTLPTGAWARGLGTAAGRARTQFPRKAGRVVGRMKKGKP